jgi:hypothetical protein
MVCVIGLDKYISMLVVYKGRKRVKVFSSLRIDMVLRRDVTEKYISRLVVVLPRNCFLYFLQFEGFSIIKTCSIMELCGV